MGMDPERAKVPATDYYATVRGNWRSLTGGNWRPRNFMGEGAVGGWKGGGEAKRRRGRKVAGGKGQVPRRSRGA